MASQAATTRCMGLVWQMGTPRLNERVNRAVLAWHVVTIPPALARKQAPTYLPHQLLTKEWLRRHG